QKKLGAGPSFFYALLGAAPATGKVGRAGPVNRRVLAGFHPSKEPSPWALLVVRRRGPPQKQEEPPSSPWRLSSPLLGIARWAVKLLQRVGWKPRLIQRTVHTMM